MVSIPSFKAISRTELTLMVSIITGVCGVRGAAVHHQPFGLRQKYVIVKNGVYEWFYVGGRSPGAAVGVSCVLPGLSFSLSVRKASPFKIKSSDRFDIRKPTSTDFPATSSFIMCVCSPFRFYFLSPPQNLPLKSPIFFFLSEQKIPRLNATIFPFPD